MLHLLKWFYAQEPNYCLNGEITAEARTAYTILHGVMVYIGTFFRNFRAKKKTKTEAHSQPDKMPQVTHICPSELSGVGLDNGL